MSLRWKIGLALAGIVFLAAAVFGTASYRSTKARLLSEVDRSLVSIESAFDEPLVDRSVLPARSPLSGFEAQVIGPTGQIRQSTFAVELPVAPADLELVGSRSSRFATVSTTDGDYRVRTVGLPRGAVQIGRSLAETDRILASLRARTLLLAGLVSAVAAAAGFVIAGRVTASLRRLTTAAEHVGATGQLDVSVADGGTDEVGRLSTAFDGMISALARSKDEQERLVQDAGHELRTPLTSLRTNVDVLQRYPGMTSADRDAILTDLRAETDELAALVDEVVAVATGAMSDEPPVSFDLAELVTETAERSARRARRPIDVVAEPSPVVADRSSVQRAVNCLLENATKFDRTDGPIDVRVGAGRVEVSDRGVGIPADDLERVFDRFHRADGARALPGSGLGLSIVREVAERHGGSAFARHRPGGGATVGFEIATLPPPS